MQKKRRNRVVSFNSNDNSGSKSRIENDVIVDKHAVVSEHHTDSKGRNDSIKNKIIKESGKVKSNFSLLSYKAAQETKKAIAIGADKVGNGDLLKTVKEHILDDKKVPIDDEDAGYSAENTIHDNESNSLYPKKVNKESHIYPQMLVIDPEISILPSSSQLFVRSDIMPLKITEKHS